MALSSTPSKDEQEINMFQNPSKAKIPPPRPSGEPGTGSRQVNSSALPESKTDLPQANPWVSHCIFKIPEFLTRSKDNVHRYQPTVVSIGPYHVGKEQVQRIQKIKQQFEDAFLREAKEKNVSKEDLVREVKAKEQDIRNSYSEDLVGFESEVLIDMMVLDGCFLLTSFLHMAKEIIFPDPVFSSPWVLSSIQRDLLLLENQLPLLVLQILLDTARIPLDGTNLKTIALHFFSYSFENPRRWASVGNDCEAKHLLDLLCQSFKPQTGTPNPPQTGTPSQPQTDVGDNLPVASLKLILSAKKLRSSGLKIQLKTKPGETFLNIRLKKGKLQIPEMILDDFVSLLLLNGIAFEQLCVGITDELTSYAMFMGCLINNVSDVTFLMEEGIIQNYLGTEEEVSRFFKDITRDYTFDIKKSYLAHVFVGVNEYTANGCHVLWAGFKKNYCGSLWIFLSSCAAFILIVLTLLQVIYAAGILAPLSHGKGKGKQD